METPDLTPEQIAEYFPPYEVITQHQGDWRDRQTVHWRLCVWHYDAPPGQQSEIVASGEAAYYGAALREAKAAYDVWKETQKSQAESDVLDLA